MLSSISQFLIWARWYYICGLSYEQIDIDKGHLERTVGLSVIITYESAGHLKIISLLRRCKTQRASIWITRDNRTLIVTALNEMVDVKYQSGLFFLVFRHNELLYHCYHAIWKTNSHVCDQDEEGSTTWAKQHDIVFVSGQPPYLRQIKFGDSGDADETDSQTIGA